jgi:hypothetical protein
MKLALCGKAGSGKSTLAKMLIDEHGYVRLAFADGIKKIAFEALGRQIDKSNPPERAFLQIIGDGARAIQSDIWIKHLDSELQTMLEQGADRIVVDDVRRVNEAEYLRSQGFMLVTVRGRGFDLGELAKHSSETEVDEIVPDFILDNSGSIEDTYEMLKGFMIMWLDAERKRSWKQ